jgi:hypothetical protein
MELFPDHHFLTCMENERAGIRGLVGFGDEEIPGSFRHLILFPANS